MQLRDAIQQVKGLAYIIEQLHICSGFSRRVLLSQLFQTDANSLQKEWEAIETVVRYQKEHPKSQPLTRIRHQLCKVKDLGGSFQNLSRGRWLDDVELFELKTFAMNAEEIATLWAETGMEIINYPSFEKVIDILDPEKTRVASFYIYNKYSDKLAQLRSQLNHSQQQLSKWRQEGKATAELQEEERVFEHIYQAVAKEEDHIRGEIATQLTPFVSGLYKAMEQLVYLDILLAKADQAMEKELTKPIISSKGTRIQGMFHPLVKDTLHEQNKRYQPIDIALQQTPHVITGANMAGKTVLLKTIATVQYMAQFGFFVPAQEAEIALVNHILISIGDEQSEESGLSSFAAEMITINEIVRKIKQQPAVLVLIDELARTTNPVEGTAIVNAVVEVLHQHQICSLITTHYNGIVAPCQRWRVKGFREEQVMGALTSRNINDYIDYSLEEDLSDIVPMEALKIARLLGIDEQLLQSADHYLHP